MDYFNQELVDTAPHLGAKSIAELGADTSLWTRSAKAKSYIAMVLRNLSYRMLEGWEPLRTTSVS
ncbi:hypothetical protein [Mesorhizobium sp. A623]